MTLITRGPDCETTAKSLRIEEIALALMGAGDLPDQYLSEGAIWDRSEGAVSGRKAIQATRTTLPACETIRMEQVISHGKAGTASGLVTRPGQGTRLFCHVIRFTSSSATTVAQVVSFEYAGRSSKT